MYKEPTFILVRSQMGENIGASARAMLNCGLHQLSLTTPRDGWPSEKAEANSAGAMALMPEIIVYPDIASAVASHQYVYATTGKLHPVAKPVFTAEGAAADMHARINRGEHVAVLFGPERAGMDNADLQQAHAFITFDTNPDFPSFNLSQAVLLVAYEFMRQRVDAPPPVALPDGDNAPAPHAELDGLVNRLFGALAEKHFFRTPEQRPTMERNLWAMLTRGQMTRQEVATFHGIITAFLGGKKPPGTRPE